jgi:hypothetical protein
MKRCTMWWGTAIEGEKNYEWFYEPPIAALLSRRRAADFPVAL